MKNVNPNEPNKVLRENTIDDGAKSRGNGKAGIVFLVVTIAIYGFIVWHTDIYQLQWE